MSAFYFGAMNRPGHYLFNQRGVKIWEPGTALPRIPWSLGQIDGGLLKAARHPDKYDGRVFLVCAEPQWLAFLWWDNSVDTRGGSNSGFYVQGFEHTERDAALAFACKAFPAVVARQRFPLILQE